MLQTGIKNICVISNRLEKVLLSEINFRLNNNKIHIILGKNGAGKSTLIKALTRLLDNKSYKINGKVLFNDTDLLSVSPMELLKIRRTEIRYVFQDAINSFDPLKNIGHHFREYEKNPDFELLLNDFLLPGKNELLKLYPYELSGGMAQRLLLIHSLIAKPKVLILDEPTSGIDTPISNLILLKLKEFAANSNNLVLLVTQDLKFARCAGDLIAYLSGGTLSPFYPTREFFENKGSLQLNNFVSAYNQLI